MPTFLFSTVSSHRFKKINRKDMIDFSPPFFFLSVAVVHSNRLRRWWWWWKFDSVICICRKSPKNPSRIQEKFGFQFENKERKFKRIMWWPNSMRPLTILSQFRFNENHEAHSSWKKGTWNNNDVQIRTTFS